MLEHFANSGLSVHLQMEQLLGGDEASPSPSDDLAYGLFLVDKVLDDALDDGAPDRVTEGLVRWKGDAMRLYMVGKTLRRVPWPSSPEQKAKWDNTDKLREEVLAFLETRGLRYGDAEFMKTMAPFFRELELRSYAYVVEGGDARSLGRE
jgi:hypothetical protein